MRQCRRLKSLSRSLISRVGLSEDFKWHHGISDCKFSHNKANDSPWISQLHGIEENKSEISVFKDWQFSERNHQGQEEMADESRTLLLMGTELITKGSVLVPMGQRWSKREGKLDGQCKESKRWWAPITKPGKSFYLGTVGSPSSKVWKHPALMSSWTDLDHSDLL